MPEINKQKNSNLNQKDWHCEERLTHVREPQKPALFKK